MEENLPRYRLLQLGAPGQNRIQGNKKLPGGNSRADLLDGGSRRARIGHRVAVLAAILLSCGCASTRAKGGEGQVLPAMPEALIGVWHRNDSDGRQACETYKKLASASDIDEESNALIGGLIITKNLVHAYSEYGEGNFYAIKRVVDLGNRSWEADASIGINTLPIEGDADEGTFRFTVASGLLSMNEMNAAGGSAHASGFFRCGGVLDGLYKDRGDSTH